MSTQVQEVRPVQEKNALGLVALIVAVVGFIFACIPGALIIGWILLPIGFILGLVSLFLKNKTRGMGIAAVIVSIVGTIVGVMVFLGAAAGAFNEAFNEETTVQSPGATVEQVDETEEGSLTDSETAEGEAESDRADAGEEGTRQNPHPLGSTISTNDWAITINDVDLDATAAVIGENPFNEEPATDETYILVNVTAEYVGTDADGATPWFSVDYVSAAGKTYSEEVAVTPDAFDSGSTLYEGGTTTGNIALIVPSEDVEKGVLAVTPSMMGDKTFVAVQ